MILAHAGVEAQEGVAAEGQHAGRLVEVEGQAFGRDVGHVEVADGRVGRAGDTEMVHAALIGVDVAVVLPDELGALLDEGVLVVIERAAFLALGVALPPGRTVHFRSGVHVAHAEMAPGIGAAGRVERHRHGVFSLEGIGRGDLVSLGGRAVAEVPEGDALHRRGVGELEDVGGVGGRCAGEGELILGRSRAQLVDVEVHRAAGEQQGRRRSGQEDEVEYLLHNQMLLSINNHYSGGVHTRRCRRCGSSRSAGWAGTCPSAD